MLTHSISQRAPSVKPENQPAGFFSAPAIASLCWQKRLGAPAAMPSRFAGLTEGWNSSTIKMFQRKAKSGTLRPWGRCLGKGVQIPYGPAAVTEESGARAPLGPRPGRPRRMQTPKSEDLPSWETCLRLRVMTGVQGSLLGAICVVMPVLDAKKRLKTAFLYL